MGDFNFYLNRQGVRGAKGAKGDKGDSPIISVAKQSVNEFVLKVNNPDGTTVESPNLVGQQIEVTASGDIVKYNRDTDAFYTSELDRATSEIEGIVRYATLADVDTREGGSAIGTDIFAQAISNVISSPDGSIIVDYDTENEETTLKIGGTLVTDVTDLKSRMTTAEEEIVNTQGDVAALDADMATKQNKLVQGDNITLTENEDGTTTIAAAGGELPDNIAYTNITNSFSGYQNFTGTVRVGYWDNKSTYLRIYSDGIEYYKSGVVKDRILFNSGYVSTTNTSFRMYINSDYTLDILKDTDNNCLKMRTYRNIVGQDSNHYFLRDIDVDGQTIQVVDGKLHANLDEIGGEVSDVSSRVTTLEEQVGDISTILDNINGEVV